MLQSRDGKAWRLEFDLNYVVNTIFFADSVFDLSQSFGGEINLTPNSTPAPTLHEIPDVPQSARIATLENKVLDPMSVAATHVDDFVIRHLPCKKFKFSHSPRGSDYFEGSPTAYPPLFGVTNIYPHIQANACYVSDMCARLQWSGNYTSFTLGGYGELSSYDICSVVCEQHLQHADAIVLNPRFIRTNTKLIHQNWEKL